MANTTPIIPRQFRWFMQNDFALKTASSSTFKFPENVIVNGVMVYITVPYSVGSTAPADIMESQAYSIINRIKVETSRADGAKWDINNIALRRLCTMVNGKRIPEPAFSLATSGGAKELVVPFYLDFTSVSNPISVYQTGANTYTKDFKLRIDWNTNMNGNAGVFKTVNDFVIDESNIKIRLAFNQHALQPNDELFARPDKLLMRNLNQENINISQTGRYSMEFEELRDYTHVHIAAIKEAASGGLITAVDDVLGEFKLIDISNSTGSNAVTFLRSSWEDLKVHTVGYFDEGFASLEAGYRTFNLIHDHRAAQAIGVNRNGDVNLNFEELQAIASHNTRLETTFEYLTKQD